MSQSTRNVIHLKITLSSVLQVIIFIPEERLDWYNSDINIHSSFLNSLYGIIIKQLTSNDNKVTSKKGRETENIYTFKQAGDIYFTYNFKLLEKHQNLLIREIFGTSAKNRVIQYKPLYVYPYQLLVYIIDPPKDKTIYTYFNIAT
ncbi:unnamed protein product [Cunninghamella echinulata]